jgi:hypothetical protein
MNQFIIEESIIRTEIESWMAFANGLRDKGDKKEFEEMVKVYHKYSSVIISSGFQPFPSKHLVLTLMFFQYRKIMQWLFNRIAIN